MRNPQDIDDMPEKDIDEQIKRLEEIRDQGLMTPRQAIRLKQLLGAKQTIKHSHIAFL